MADFAGTNAGTPCTHVERAGERSLLSLIKGNKLVALYARKVVEFSALWFVAFDKLASCLATHETLAGGDEALVTDKLERWRLHEAEAVYVKSSVTLALTQQQVNRVVFFIANRTDPRL